MRVSNLYTRYYDGYTSHHAHDAEIPKPQESPCETEAPEKSEIAGEIASCKTKLPFNLDTDEIILIAVLFLIASEGSDDFILPLILGYLLISNT